MLRVERLEARDVPAYVLASGGGWLYGLDPATGAEQRSLQLDPGYDGALHPAAVDHGDFVVGAGEGGGPRLVRYDGITWTPEWSVFVGDPNSRKGVFPEFLESFSEGGSIIRVEPHPEAPGSPSSITLIERHLAAMPDGVEEYLAIREQVYFSYAGEITDLTEFRDKKGVPGWENVGSLGPLYYGAPIYLQDGTPGASVVYHETGHAIIAFASEEQKQAGVPYQQWWDYRWTNEVYPYEVWEGVQTLNWNEAIAEEIAQKLAGQEDPRPRVSGFLNEMFASLGF